MSEQKFPRRTLLKGALLGAAAVPVSALLSRTATAASGRVDPSEPQAKSLGYVEDAAGTIAGVYPFLVVDSSAPSVTGTPVATLRSTVPMVRVRIAPTACRPRLPSRA